MADFKNLNISKDIDIDNDSHDANAIGAGSVAGSGFANVVAATGFQSVAAQDSEVNQADHGSQVLSHSDVDQNQFASPGAVQAHGDASGINTGLNAGVVAGGHVSDTVVGDGNRVANIDGDADGAALGFGSGHTNAASFNDVEDGALSAGGNAQNASHNFADHGAAIGADDAFGSNREFTETNVVASDNTNLATNHSDSFADQLQTHHTNEIHDSLVHGHADLGDFDLDG
ncbi:MAG TPA: hypothetical protein VHN80_31195 [Kineosporiaceae bacterium]|nr:hypothetical protein [Kineosporiaceae bacterium]